MSFSRKVRKQQERKAEQLARKIMRKIPATKKDAELFTEVFEAVQAGYSFKQIRESL